MTELDSYSINTNLKTAKARAEIAPASNNTPESCEHFPVIVRCPRLDSKIILQNMEEVLDSVKKQHKAKHKRKKELKRLSKIESAIDSEIASGANGETKIKKKEQFGKKSKHRDKEKRHCKKSPLQEKSTVENDKLLQASPAKNGTILKHFARTPKKEKNNSILVEQLEINAGDESENIEKSVTPSKHSKLTNAFEVMMNARNKSIGSNSAGKDSPSPVGDKEMPAVNAKRKLKLQEWSELKGASKRKLLEEERAAYIEEQLEQRAKRFKQMLASGATPNTSADLSSTTCVKTKNKLLEGNKKQNNRKRKRDRRLSSTDSADSLKDLATSKADVEISEFLDKLNSPTKKKDSLLGYFPKKESPKEQLTKYISERTVQGDASNRSTNDDSGHEFQESVESTFCVRPRRSCARKARYDYDLDGSPSKIKNTGKTPPVRKTSARKVNNQGFKSVEQDSVEIIILDESTMTSDVTPQGTPKKLAPVFVRSIPKPSPDPAILKARKAFLQSGVPEKLRIEQEKQKQYEQIFEEASEIFPKISHVKQLSKSELEFDKETLKVSLKLSREENVIYSPSPTRKCKSRPNKRLSIAGSLSDCLIRDYKLHKKKKYQDYPLNQVTLPSLANKRAIIKNWKTEFERFPTYKCYNQMREKYRYFSAIDSAQDTEQVSESFVVTRRNRRSLEAENKKEQDISDEDYKPPATAPNGELLFSEKYKPLLFEQVLVNLSPVTQLKEFLSNWSHNGGQTARNSQTLDDSLYISDSTCSNQAAASNTVVLLGPVSSGKTNAVFALANEMNFNVLEINAGMKRTGKRLIQELQEATQSHQIRKDTATSSSTQKSLLRMSLHGIKSKLQKPNSYLNLSDSQNNDSNSSDLQNPARKCLILIEDADIVFEQTDAGFTDAIYSLAASSKRPVIVVASNSNCVHLQRLMSQNTIHFFSPNVMNISKFLAVLSLIENCPIKLDDLISLYLYNRRDLRRTLLELQFFIQSGGDRHRPLLNESLWKENAKRKTNYFASPRKRQFSVEQHDPEVNDNSISNGKNSSSSKSSQDVYMHHSLFEYFTVGQNTTCRIPFPINFHLLNVNLNEIFKVSRKLKEDLNQKIWEASAQLTTTKRKSRSPKKQWLTTVRANSRRPLDSLCSFYENLSIAALMDQQEKQKHSIIDRLKPNICENISHCLLEKTIEVDLDAKLCRYNLFDTPKASVSLFEEFGSMQSRTIRARCLDYEPFLRSICRSEKRRSTLERRSTRFYHYLRNYTISASNFSNLHFDHASDIFQTFGTEKTETKSPQLAITKPT